MLAYTVDPQTNALFIREIALPIPRRCFRKCQLSFALLPAVQATAPSHHLRIQDLKTGLAFLGAFILSDREDTPPMLSTVMSAMLVLRRTIDEHSSSSRGRRWCAAVDEDYRVLLKGQRILRSSSLAES
jgi:hypothetical protein